MWLNQRPRSQNYVSSCWSIWLIDSALVRFCLRQNKFVAAAGEVFATLTGDEVTDAVRQELAEFLAVANAEDPTQLLAPGVENWVSLSVLAQVRKAG